MLKLKKKVKEDKGMIIPFKNGVIIKKDNFFSFEPHSKKNYITHMLNVSYDKEATIENTPFEIYLNSISDNSPEKLGIIRACLYCIITNNTDYQIGLYIYGSGGTGKSTLVNLLLYILGSESSYSTNLKSITSRFGLTNISNKLLIILNEMGFYKGEEPKIVKELIAGDPLEKEVKYKNPVSIIPNL